MIAAPFWIETLGQAISSTGQSDLVLFKESLKGAIAFVIFHEVLESRKRTQKQELRLKT